MPKVELLSFPSCPNVARARERLVRAFASARLTPSWTEHATGDPMLPPYARGFGSPTILVDGRDILGEEASGSAEACRLKIPEIATLIAALEGNGERTKGWRLNFATLPGFALALLPKVACPACWPAYAGLLGALGLGFLIETRWLLPLTTLFLVAALGALAYRARQRRGFKPFLAGVVAAGLVLVGKFHLESALTMDAGLALLITSSVWNTWPLRKLASASCPACAPARDEVELSPGATTEMENPG